MLRGRELLENGKIEEMADTYGRFFLSRLVIPASSISQDYLFEKKDDQPKGIIFSCKAGKHQQRRAGDV